MARRGISGMPVSMKRLGSVQAPDGNSCVQGAGVFGGRRADRRVQPEPEGPCVERHHHLAARRRHLPDRRRRIAAWRGGVPSLKLVLIAGGVAPEGCVALAPEMEAASDRFETARTTPEDMALIHFTSGTTGKPKGAVHVHGAVVAHAATGRFALDLKPGDIYWCTADPG